MPARSIAASTPELPPPITATRLPLNSGPSQCGQYATPLLRYSFSPGTFICRQRAPVEMITDFAFSAAPFANCTSMRSEEHTSELQSLMRISYAVFCLTKKNHNQQLQSYTQHINHHSENI